MNFAPLFFLLSLLLFSLYSHSFIFFFIFFIKQLCPNDWYNTVYLFLASPKWMKNKKNFVLIPMKTLTKRCSICLQLCCCWFSGWPCGFPSMCNDVANWFVVVLSATRFFRWFFSCFFVLVSRQKMSWAPALLSSVMFAKNFFSDFCWIFPWKNFISFDFNRFVS